ncbi:hypothetical protein [Verrucomicrobium spinosum]|uniref:hypothetical protein n=1 Tax=Verrucomicrobium spinosum TaxID=2736 RepID=UPI000B20D2C6|nr:hypothetical protein [Verrucomicrobium spinosum]
MNTSDITGLRKELNGHPSGTSGRCTGIFDAGQAAVRLKQGFQAITNLTADPGTAAHGIHPPCRILGNNLSDDPAIPANTKGRIVGNNPAPDGM